MSVLDSRYCVAEFRTRHRAQEPRPKVEPPKCTNCGHSINKKQIKVGLCCACEDAGVKPAQKPRTREARSTSRRDKVLPYLTDDTPILQLPRDPIRGRIDWQAAVTRFLESGHVAVRLAEIREMDATSMANSGRRCINVMGASGKCRAMLHQCRVYLVRREAL